MKSSAIARVDVARWRRVAWWRLRMGRRGRGRGWRGWEDFRVIWKAWKGVGAVRLVHAVAVRGVVEGAEVKEG
jgi:hypothetical protein